MAFDPDAYLATYDKGSSEGFDPDAYLATYEPQAATPSLAERASGFLRGMFKAKAPSLGGLKRLFGMGAVDAATAPIEQPLRTGAQIIKDNPEGALEALPAIAATGAGLATGGLGAIPAALAVGGAGAAGRIAAQEGRRAIGLNPVSPQQPTVPFIGTPIPDIPGLPQTVSRPIIEAGLQAGPELLGRGVSKLFSRGGKAVEEAGINSARRSQGFQKSQLTSSKSWSEAQRKMGKAAEAAKTSLERGDIPLSGSPNEMFSNSLKQLDEGKAMTDSALDAVRKSGKTVTQGEVDDAILKMLDPKNEDELAAALKIERALKDAAVGGKVSVDALSNLRQSFGQTGFRDKTVGTAAADMYRGAWKAVSDQLKKLLGDADPKLVRQYTEGMKMEEMANVSLGAITNRMAAEQGNALMSLPALGTEVTKRALAPIGVGLFRGGQRAQQFAPEVGKAAATGFRAILERAKARAAEEQSKKTIAPAFGQKASRDVPDGKLSEFVQNAKVGTRFTYQGKPFKIVPAKTRDTAGLSKEEKSTLFASKRLNRGRNTFASA